MGNTVKKVVELQHSHGTTVIRNLNFRKLNIVAFKLTACTAWIRTGYLESGSIHVKKKLLKDDFGDLFEAKC